MTSVIRLEAGSAVDDELARMKGKKDACLHVPCCSALLCVAAACCWDDISVLIKT